jgi:putative phage-type endonuclease
MPELACSNRAAWLAARREGIGGSEAAAVLGLSPFQTPLQVWAEKLGFAEPQEESERMQWGRRLEPLLAERYAEETERLLEAPDPYRIHVHPDTPYLRATLDRVIVSAEASKRVPAPLELKTTGYQFLDEWLTEPPVHVQVQGQHQLLVTGWSWVSYAVLIAGQTFRWVDAERNERFLTLLQERLAEFWRRVELADPPPAQGEDKALLEALHPKEKTGVTVALPAEAVQWDQRRGEIIGEMRRLSLEKDTLDAYLREAIGDAEFGRLPSGVRYSWRRIDRAEFVSPATSYRELRRLRK